VWLRPRTTPDPTAVFKTRALAYAGAKAAFQKLTGAGVDQDLLWRRLWGLAWAKAVAGRQISPWYKLPGLPPHRLRRFPGRVRRMAEEIERTDSRIRADKGYGPTVAFLPFFLAGAIPGAKAKIRVDGKLLREIGTGKRTVPASLARGVLHRHAELPKLADLPNLLRLYADFIEVVDRFVAHHAPRGAALMEAMMPLELAELVKEQTGSHRWSEVATLLTAAYQANGCNATVDPRALKMQYSRRSRQK